MKTTLKGLAHGSFGDERDQRGKLSVVRCILSYCLLLYLRELKFGPIVHSAQERPSIRRENRAPDLHGPDALILPMGNAASGPGVDGDRRPFPRVQSL
jgi:hypothetical protein